MAKDQLHNKTYTVSKVSLALSNHISHQLSNSTQDMETKETYLVNKTFTPFNNKINSFNKITTMSRHRDHLEEPNNTNKINSLLVIPFLGRGYKQVITAALQLKNHQLNYMLHQEVKAVSNSFEM